MEEEKLKIYWKLYNKMSNTKSMDENTLKKLIAEEIRETSLSRLSLRYKRFSIFAFIAAILSFFYAQIPIFERDMRIILCLSMVFFFMTASCMDYYLYSRIQNINLYSMSTSEVLKRLITTKKLHIIFIAILLPMALALVFVLILACGSDTEVIYGLIGGGIVGLGIGIMKLLDFFRDYKNLISEEKF